MTEARETAATAETDPQLAHLVETWRRACTDFVTLVREIPPEQWDLPTELAGWSVKDNVAHTAHLEAVLAGAPEETVEVAPAPHLRGPMGYYTEQGVLARRGRDMESLAQEIEQSVARRYAELGATPLTDGSAAPPRTPGGARWDYQTMLSNRPLDVWMHEQDIRRTIGRPGGFDSPVAGHVLRLLGRSLPMVVGKRVAPRAGTTIRLDIPEAALSWTVRVGADGRAAQVDHERRPDTAITLTPEEFVALAGGRCPVSATQPRIEGDEELGHRLLESLAVTP